MNPLRIWWADSRGKVIATLVALWAGALITHFEVSRVWQPFVAVAAVSAFDYLVSRIRHQHGVVTMSAVVTGLLIGLVFDESAGLVPLVAACFVAVVGKQLVAFGDHRHIANPAALGILTASLVFGRPVAWWGAAWGMIPAVIILYGMAGALMRLRRLWMGTAFIVLYFIMNVFTGGIQGAINLTIDGTVFLFAFIMLPEPITSVGGGLWQYGWGVLVAVLVYAQSRFLQVNVDPLLTALLGADVIGFFFVRKLWR